MKRTNDGGIQTIEDPEGLQKLYAKTNYVLREARKAVLEQYQVEDEIALLEKIKGGQLEEHPAYAHYLSARIMEQMRQHVRGDMLAQLGGGADAAQTSVHLLLKGQLEVQYADRLAEPVRLAPDALMLSFDNGLMMEVRYYSAEEYLFNWHWGEASLRIDTAPVHPECTTFPQHLHGADGMILADPVTVPGADCWTNFSNLLDVLLANPLLELPNASVSRDVAPIF